MQRVENLLDDRQRDPGQFDSHDIESTDGVLVTQDESSVTLEIDRTAWSGLEESKGNVIFASLWFSFDDGLHWDRAGGCPAAGGDHHDIRGKYAEFTTYRRSIPKVGSSRRRIRVRIETRASLRTSCHLVIS